jgi:hypothetical protein
MINNNARIGNFTSSNIHKLLSKAKNGKDFGAPALTYIAEKNMERILGRSVHTEVDARPLQWGKCCEDIVFEMLPMDYQRLGDETIVHPKYDCWAGSPDVRTDNKGGEIKCPHTLASFFTLVYGGTIYGMVDGFEINGFPFKGSTSGQQYLTQTISNGILLDLKQAEFIVFMPSKSMLDRIRDNAKFLGYNWIAYATDDELPYLPDGHPKAGINIIGFNIESREVDELTEAVEEGSKLLIPRTNITIHDNINGHSVTVHDSI